MLASARMFPENSVFAPRVAELPTAHHTLVALAPPVTTTLASAPVTSVLPIWKIQIESALPLRVSVPVVTAADVGKQWTPGGRSEEHTSELQSPYDLVCRLLLE